MVKGWVEVVVVVVVMVVMVVMVVGDQGGLGWMGGEREGERESVCVCAGEVRMQGKEEVHNTSI